MKITAILEMLSEHRQLSSQVSGDLKDFEDYLHEDELLQDLLTKMKWKDYVEPDRFVDNESAMAIIDHVRSEVQSSGIMSVTVWAAIIGALLGSLVTLLVTRIP